MTTRIEILTSLQRIDRGIREKQREVEETTRKLRELEDVVQQRAAEATRLRVELATKTARQRELERELSEIESKMKDRRVRLQRIRNEKEMQATQREIDGFKERTGKLEEEELEILEEVEALGTNVVSAEENLRGGKDALESERAALVERDAILAKELRNDDVTRRELAASLDDGLRRRYEMLFARRGGTAVVGVRDGTCEGCHMNVPPQLFNEILKADQIHACPSCQRILFCVAEHSEQSA